MLRKHDKQRLTTYTQSQTPEHARGSVDAEQWSSPPFPMFSCTSKAKKGLARLEAFL